MGSKSTIAKLAPEIRAEVQRLLHDGATIAQVVAHLQGLDVTVSKSSVGRFAQDFRAVGARIREAREIAGTWVTQLGAAPDSDVGRLLAEMLRTVAFQQLMGMSGGETGGDIAPPKPGDLALLARAIKDLSTADKTSADREIKIRAQMAAQVAASATQAAEAVDQAVRAAGITGKTAEAIRALILGITPKESAK
ncbi:MAG: DUF3486 family protein [Nitrospirota bacterium]|nr:DUF3486 family protein [Nitrospirota bacterium]